MAKSDTPSDEVADMYKRQGAYSSPQRDQDRKAMDDYYKRIEPEVKQENKVLDMLYSTGKK